MAGGIVLGSVAVSAVSAVSADVLLYISVAIKASFLARRGRMSSERYCHTPGVVVVVVVIVVVVVDNFRLKFLFINLSQVKVSVY